MQGGAIIDGQNALDRNQGFYIDGSYNTVDGFEIRNCTHGGISIWADNNRIINNNIHNNGNPADSSGNGRDGVYSSENTSGGYYGCNYIHDNGRTGSNLDHGLYLCGKNETVINNVLVRNAATGLQVAGYATVSGMRVYNNVVAWNGTTGIILWLSLDGVDIKNNIIYRNGNYGLGSYDAHGSGVVVDHNLCFNNGGGNYNFTAGGSDYSYTLGTTISSDPRFVNNTSAGLDVHLASGSPCIGAGLNLYSAFTTDLAGAARPSSGAWDLGSYVSGAANAAPTISGIANQTILAGAVVGPLAFTVSDAQTPAGNLTVSASSSSTTLVPNTSILLGGGGSNRTVTVTPTSGLTGTATITLTVSDGSLSSSTRFTVTVNALAAPVITLTSPANGASFTAPATTTLVASVTPNGHAISQVEFYNGGTLLGTTTTAPYSLTVSGVAAGSYTVSAAAVYDGGSTVTSPAVSLTVTTPASGLSFAATSGAISAPYVAADGVISQPAYTSLAASGQAVYTFNVTAAGNYVVTAMVNASSTAYNSLWVNIDAQPADPLMIWDVPVTSGSVSQTVSWRGNGVVSSSARSGLTAQYAPKVFSLSAGTHQLILRGREANCQVGMITIAPTTLSAN